MKALVWLLLAWVVQAQEVPMTPQMMQSIQNFVWSSIAVCQKRNIPEDKCSQAIESTTKAIRKRADEVCKDYPKEKIPCLQYWLSYLMDRVTEKI